MSSWGLFWVGHFFSKIFEFTYLEFFFDIYSWCMHTSLNIQDRYDIDNGPWLSIEEEEESLNSSDQM